jgi:hypothetical protein
LNDWIIGPGSTAVKSPEKEDLPVAKQWKKGKEHLMRRVLNAHLFKPCFMLREVLGLNDRNSSHTTKDLQIVHILANTGSTQTVNGAIKDGWMQDIS